MSDAEVGRSDRLMTVQELCSRVKVDLCPEVICVTRCDVACNLGQTWTPKQDNYIEFTFIFDHNVGYRISLPYVFRLASYSLSQFIDLRLFMYYTSNYTATWIIIQCKQIDLTDLVFFQITSHKMYVSNNDGQESS